MADLQFSAHRRTINSMSKILHNSYKVIIVDVDGTLVTNEFGGKISAKVKKTVLGYKHKIQLGIASGRPLQRVTFIFDELQLTIPCVISGGAQVVDPVTRMILWEQPIEPLDLTPIREILQTVTTNIWVVDETKEIKYAHDMALSKPLNFFIPRIEEKKADVIMAGLSHIPTLALTKIVAYHEGCVALMITHANATKEHAIEKVKELLELKSHNVIGMGDGHNDMPLFRACGFRVAVGNAIPLLKEAADYIAPSVNDDAVAHVIEKFSFN